MLRSRPNSAANSASPRCGCKALARRTWASRSGVQVRGAAPRADRPARPRRRLSRWPRSRTDRAGQSRDPGRYPPPHNQPDTADSSPVCAAPNRPGRAPRSWPDRSSVVPDRRSAAACRRWSGVAFMPSPEDRKMPLILPPRGCVRQLAQHQADQLGRSEKV